MKNAHGYKTFACSKKDKIKNLIIIKVITEKDAERIINMTKVEMIYTRERESLVEYDHCFSDEKQ